jgi:hypothetical protein
LTLHVLNSFLLYKILNKINGKNTALLSLLYLVHPLHFFTITWIIQLKTLLSILFFLLSALSFLKYRETKIFKFIIFAVILFSLSLLSKAVFAPIIIYFIFVKEKKIAIPFIVVCTISLFATLWVSHIEQLGENHVLEKQMAQAKQVESLATLKSKEAQILPIANLALTLKNFSKYSGYVIYPWKNLLVHPDTVVSFSLFDLIPTLTVILIFIYACLYFWAQAAWSAFYGLAFFAATILPLAGAISWPIFFYSNFIEYWLTVPLLGIILFLASFKWKRSLTVILLIFISFYFSRAYVSARHYASSDKIILNSIESSPRNDNLKIILANHYFFTKKYDESNAVLEKLKDRVPPSMIKKLQDKNYTHILRGDFDEDYSY